MYKVYLHLKTRHSEPVAQITISSEHSFSEVFRHFVYQSSKIITPQFYMEDDYSPCLIDVYLYLVDTNLDALVSFLHLIEHCSSVFYKHTFNKCAISDFESDVADLLKDLPF